MSQSNAPLHDIRVGQGIKATIWANENDKGVWHNVTIIRHLPRRQWKTARQQQLYEGATAVCRKGR